MPCASTYWRDQVTTHFRVTSIDLIQSSAMTVSLFQWHPLTDYKSVNKKKLLDHISTAHIVRGFMSTEVPWKDMFAVFCQQNNITGGYSPTTTQRSLVFIPAKRWRCCE